MADGQGKGGILDQLLQEAAALGARQATEKDSVLKLTATGKDGTVYEVEGIPQSQAAKWLKDKFGIGDDEGDEGQGDEGGQQQGGSTVRDFFGLRGGQQQQRGGQQAG